MTTTDAKRIETYREFWDFYVREHSEPLTRCLHFAGTILGIVLLIWILRTGSWIYLPACFVVGYAFAWLAHFFVEHNQPATFKYPLWSFVSDYKMTWLMLIGRMDAEVRRVSDE